jgi:hypothetical protein
MSNLSQFLQNSAIPVGQSVPMPALANAGTNQFVTASNELYVNTATPSVVPQSSCNALLPAALGAMNDVTMSASQVSLLGFQQAANVPASGYYTGLITTAAQQSTKGFYVNGVYYLFSPNDVENTIGWISTADTVNYTPFVPVTPLAGLMIVDVFYNTTSGTWYFLEANGSIFSTTNLTTFANAAFYSLPQLGVANGYVRLTCINSVWYAIGGSTSSTGYRVSSSANLTNWTVVLENTAGSGPAFNIISGAGAGAATEILVCCVGNTLLKSVNNGTSFTAVTTAISIASNTPSINNIFYSSRTGLYYVATTTTATSMQVYLSVSTTGTLATAGWTNYSTGYSSAGSAYTANIGIIDTGTWVGPVFMTTAWTVNFLYGTSYNTLSANIIANAQVYALESGTQTYYQGAKAMWLNGALMVAYSSQPDGNFSYARSNVMLAVASGPTCGTGISINLWLPLSNTTTAAVEPVSQWNSWSGVVYMGGAYYAGAGAQSMSGSTFYFYTMYLIKIASTLATFSCPVAPAQGSFNNVAMDWGEMIALSCPVVAPNGTSLYWAAFQNYNAGNTSATLGYTPVFTFNGTLLTSYTLPGAANSGTSTGEGVLHGYCINGQPSGNVSVPKWSGLLNAYVVGLPALAYGSGYAATIQSFSSLSSGAMASSLLAVSSGSNYASAILGLDVLSTGGVVAVIAAGASLSLYVDMGNGMVSLATQGYNNTAYVGQPNSYAIWEVVYNGTSYLVFAYGTGTPSINIYKLSTTDGPTPVLQGYPVPNISLAATVTNNLRRVFAYNSGFCLGDTAAASVTTRNSLILTPNGIGSFNVAPTWLQASGDFTPAGKPNTYTTMNTVTTLNTAGVPSVFIPAGTAGNYLRAR